jgi:hypothetical protein
MANLNPCYVHSFPGQGAGSSQVYTTIENKMNFSFYNHEILAYSYMVKATVKTKAYGRNVTNS